MGVQILLGMTYFVLPLMLFGLFFVTYIEIKQRTQCETDMLKALSTRTLEIEKLLEDFNKAQGSIDRFFEGVLETGEFRHPKRWDEVFGLNSKLYYLRKARKAAKKG